MGKIEEYVYFVLKIDAHGEKAYDIGKQLQPVLDQEFGARLLRTEFCYFDPLSTRDGSCWTCGGDPDSHPSGLRCVCEDGTHQSEVANLRKLADQALETFNEQTMQGAKERLGTQNKDRRVRFSSKTFHTVSEHAMHQESENRHFHIVLDVEHPHEVSAQTIYAQIMGSWEVGDLVQKLENDDIHVGTHWREGKSVWRQEHTFPQEKPEKEREKGERGEEKTQEMDASTEQWNPQWLRGTLIDLFRLPATADNWTILETVRMQGHHWRSAIFKIQEMLHTHGDGPTTVQAVRVRLQETVPLQTELQRLREENARLQGVIEGMEKGNRHHD